MNRKSHGCISLIDVTELKDGSMSQKITYTVWVKKVAPPKTYCDIFTYGESVQLKITVAIAQTYFYVYTNFRPFILIFV